ncbi:hypothetical protein PR048_017476 [Dryococelus australis]|uniref:Uncharacterized protein n=1 Tax=Dryococelus australis TaxID=614101 RepID=A0ABQ9HA82_9NEOP|nr:hypothetical protein PR048_017476 [Dryococelus australis]
MYLEYTVFYMQALSAWRSVPFACVIGSLSCTKVREVADVRRCFGRNQDCSDVKHLEKWRTIKDILAACSARPPVEFASMRLQNPPIFHAANCYTTGSNSDIDGTDHQQTVSVSNDFTRLRSTFVIGLFQPLRVLVACLRIKCVQYGCYLTLSMAQSNTTLSSTKTRAAVSCSLADAPVLPQAKKRGIRPMLRCRRSPLRQTGFNSRSGHSGFSQVNIVQDDTAGRRVFSAISRFPRRCIPPLLHSHLISTSSSLETSLLRAAQNFSTHNYFIQHKIDFQRMYIEVTLVIGSEFIRHTLDDSAPIAEFQGNKKRIPYCQMWGNSQTNKYLSFDYTKDCGSGRPGLNSLHIPGTPLLFETGSRGVSVQVVQGKKKGGDTLNSRNCWARHAVKEDSVTTPPLGRSCVRLPSRPPCTPCASTEYFANSYGGEVDFKHLFFSPAVVIERYFFRHAPFNCELVICRKQSYEGVLNSPVIRRHLGEATNRQTIVSRVYRGLRKWSSAGLQGRGKRNNPEKTRRPAASSCTIPTCENPGMTRPGIELGSPWWEANSLTRDTSGGCPPNKIIPLLICYSVNNIAYEYGGYFAANVFEMDETLATREMFLEMSSGGAADSSPRMISSLASHQGEPGSIPGRVTGLSHVVIVPDDAVDRLVFSEISRFPRPSIPALYYVFLGGPNHVGEAKRPCPQGGSITQTVTQLEPPATPPTPSQFTSHPRYIYSLLRNTALNVPHLWPHTENKWLSCSFDIRQTHSLVGWARLWIRVVCLIGYCIPRKGSYWLDCRVESRLLGADGRTAPRRVADPRENPPTSGIVWHDSHMRKSGSDPTGNLILFAYKWKLLTSRAPSISRIELAASLAEQSSKQARHCRLLIGCCDQVTPPYRSVKHSLTLQLPAYYWLTVGPSWGVSKQLSSNHNSAKIWWEKISEWNAFPMDVPSPMDSHKGERAFHQGRKLDLFTSSPEAINKRRKEGGSCNTGRLHLERLLWGRCNRRTGHKYHSRATCPRIQQRNFRSYHEFQPNAPAEWLYLPSKYRNAANYRMHIDTGDNNMGDQRPVALTRKVLNLRAVLPQLKADKIDIQCMYEVTLAIGSEYIRHTLDDSAPIADLQGNKKRIPYCQMWGNTGATAKRTNI